MGSFALLTFQWILVGAVPIVTLMLMTTMLLAYLNISFDD